MDAPRDPTSPLERVRADAARVMRSARYVEIETGALATLAPRLADGGLQVAAGPWLAETVGGDEATAALVLTLATVNFGSGYHPVVRKLPGCSGATTMATHVRAWAADEPVTARRLRALTVDDAFVLFDQPSEDAAVAELVHAFTVALVELGTLVDARYDGSFAALVAAAYRHAASLVDRLLALPSFRDEATYDGQPVAFYKRAQLAAADLHRAFGGEGLGRFDDLDRLTAFADNLVPHVLRVEGVLRYDPELAARIDRGELLPAGSPAEVEIRAAGVHAVELLRDELASHGVAARPCDLDAILWHRGATPRFKAIPRHRTRGTFY